jgi:hypothetical protein
MPIPPEVTSSPRTTQQFCCVIISTYERDEPLAELFLAADIVGDQFRFFVTGNSKKLAADLMKRVPGNVTLTGFLKERAYWQLLVDADAVIDLTTMDNCLVCGAYEATSLGKPLLLSRSQASLDCFGAIAIHTENDADSIAINLRVLRREARDRAAALPRFRHAFETDWRGRRDALHALLANKT